MICLKGLKVVVFLETGLQFKDLIRTEQQILFFLITGLQFKDFLGSYSRKTLRILPEKFKLKTASHYTFWRRQRIVSYHIWV